MGKDLNKPVKRDDPSLNLEGGAKNRIWKRKKETYHQGELFPTAKGPSTDVNDNKRRYA